MRSALLVIDVQRGLFAPKPQPFEAVEVIERINALAQNAREAGAPVFSFNTKTSLSHFPMARPTGSLPTGSA